MHIAPDMLPPGGGVLLEALGVFVAGDVLRHTDIHVAAGGVICD